MHFPHRGVITYPTDNPSSSAKVELGRLLFWDPLLSGDHDIACATCHHPDFAYTDGRKLSVGTGGVGLGPSRVAGSTPHFTTRNAMTVLNVAWNGRTLAALPAAESAPMFWDDRVRSLETQARGPTSALAEMRGTSFDPPRRTCTTAPSNTLDQVLDLYRNVDDGADPKLRALRVPEGSDGDDVIAFLRSLGDGDYDRAVPPRVPSGLAVGGAIR